MQSMAMSPFGFGVTGGAGSWKFEVEVTVSKGVEVSGGMVERVVGREGGRVNMRSAAEIRM